MSNIESAAQGASRAGRPSEKFFSTEGLVVGRSVKDVSPAALRMVTWLMDLEGYKVHTNAGDPGGTTVHGIASKFHPEVLSKGWTYYDSVDLYWRKFIVPMFKDIGFSTGNLAMDSSAEAEIDDFTMTAFQFAVNVSVPTAQLAVRSIVTGLLAEAPLRSRKDIMSWKDASEKLRELDVSFNGGGSELLRVAQIGYYTSREKRRADIRRNFAGFINRAAVRSSWKMRSYADTVTTLESELATA